MKARYIAYTIICLILSGCHNDREESHFTITGEIKNVEDNYMVILVKSAPGESSAEMIAIDTLVDGRFCFTAPADENAAYRLVTPHVGIFSSMSVEIYTEPGADIKIKGDGYLIKDWMVESKVKNQKIYQSYLSQVAPMLHQMQEMELEYRKMGKSSEYLQANDFLEDQIDDVRLSWLKNQKKLSVPWLDLMYQSSNAAYAYKDQEIQKKLSAIWSNVDPETRESNIGKIISNLLSPSGPTLRVGDRLPMDTRMYDIEGNTHTFNDFMGKPILLYFGSYGCKPCVSAKKDLDELAENRESLEIIGLNLDNETAWRRKGKVSPVKWHDFNENKGSYGLSSRFETAGIPTFVIVSAEGKIIDIWAGYDEGIITERLDNTGL